VAETLTNITDAETSPRTDQESAPRRTPAGIGGWLIFVLLELWIGAGFRLVAGSPRVIAFIGIGGVHVNRTPAGLLPAITSIAFGFLGVLAGLLLAKKSSKGLIFAKIVLLIESGYYAMSLFNVLVATGPAVATAIPAWLRPAGCLLASVLCVFYLFRSRRVVNTFFAASAAAATTETDSVSNESDDPRISRIRTWDEFTPGQPGADSDAVDPRIERIRPWAETRFVLKAEPQPQPQPQETQPSTQPEEQSVATPTVVLPRPRRPKESHPVPQTEESKPWSWPPESKSEPHSEAPSEHLQEPHPMVQEQESQPWPPPEEISPAPQGDAFQLAPESEDPQLAPTAEQLLPAPEAIEPDIEPEPESDPTLEPAYSVQSVLQPVDFYPAPEAEETEPAIEETEPMLSPQAAELEPGTEPHTDRPQQPIFQAEEFQPEPAAQHAQPEPQPEPVAEELAPVPDLNEFLTLKAHIIDGTARWLSSPSNNMVHASFLRDARTSGELDAVQDKLLRQVSEICDRAWSIQPGQFPSLPNTAVANSSLAKELQKWSIAQAEDRLTRSFDIRAAMQINGPFENLIEDRDYLLAIVEENSSDNSIGKKLGLAEYEASSAPEIALALILQAQRDMYQAEMWAQVASLAGDSEFVHTFAQEGSTSFQASLHNWSVRLSQMHEDRRLFHPVGV
jgi:hypothetical protein